MKDTIKKICNCLGIFAIVFGCVIVLGKTATASATMTIPSKAKEFEGHMYYVYTGTSVTADDAENKCDAAGGHLVSITSAEEQDFVLGLLNDSGQSKAWIGATYYSDGTTKWTTGESISYVPSGSKKPYSYHYRTTMKATTGQWVPESTVSTQKYMAYICEWDTSTETVLPKKVESIKVKKSSKTSVNISWKKVSDSIGYTVYMKVGKNGEYKLVADTEDKDITTISQTELKKGKTYYFRVRAYKEIYGERSYGELSEEKKIKLK